MEGGISIDKVHAQMFMRQLVHIVCGTITELELEAVGMVMDSWPTSTRGALSQARGKAEGSAPLGYTPKTLNLEPMISVYSNY